MVLGQQQRYAAAACFYAEAFTADSHLLTGRPSGHRYNAACAAALAGCGRGRDAADLDEKSRAAFRRQALDWLRAELEAQRRLLEQEPEKARWVVAGNLHGWLGDSDFDGVRGPEALARLPAAERQAWQELWADLADTLAGPWKGSPVNRRPAAGYHSLNGRYSGGRWA
jgi:serine/threonine-protein kinase